ncbi:hypothetical protein IFM89_034204 [Coptis chinensis]|uniref:Uncharacterized protein n=1 Tax=Coptis chinensis TaxID=261450 RepID=A0A835LK96_9MAGN|nr:hypothetical protein IFM89_034204 [Coptis chinensis]
MARTNKYTSINFNDLFEKKSSSSSKSNNNKKQPASSSSTTSLRNHDGMLVLTRPSPKPIQPQHPKTQPIEHKPESISLRPLGRTASSTLTPTTTQEREKEVVPVFKPEAFVPPHLRPGFVGKEEKLVGQNGQRNIGPVNSSNTDNNNGYDENGRPKSGSGYERMRRNGGGGGYGGMGDVNRPRSSSGSGNRPGSGGGGRYGSSTHF